MSKEEFEKIAKQRMMNFGQQPVDRYDDGEQRKTHLITDTGAVPPIGQAIYKAFNIALKISDSAIKSQLTAPVKTKDGKTWPSPHAEFTKHPDLFLDFLKTLPSVLKFMDKRPTTSNVLGISLGYDWAKDGWM